MITDARQNTQTILEYFLAALAAKKKGKKAACLILLFFNYIPTQLYLFLYPKKQHRSLPPPPQKSKIP